MVLLQNTKPKKTKPKLSAKLNFLSSNEMPMKLKTTTKNNLF